MERKERASASSHGCLSPSSSIPSLFISISHSLFCNTQRIRQVQTERSQIQRIQQRSSGHHPMEVNWESDEEDETTPLSKDQILNSIGSINRELSDLGELIQLTAMRFNKLRTEVSKVPYSLLSYFRFVGGRLKENSMYATFLFLSFSQVTRDYQKLLNKQSSLS